MEAMLMMKVLFPYYLPQKIMRQVKGNDLGSLLYDSGVKKSLSCWQVLF